MKAVMTERDPDDLWRHGDLDDDSQKRATTSPPASIFERRAASSARTPTQAGAIVFQLGDPDSRSWAPATRHDHGIAFAGSAVPRAAACTSLLEGRP